MLISIAKSWVDIERCFPVMVQLRTALTKEEYTKSVTNQEEAGYKLAFVEDNDQIVAVAGFRIMNNLAYGKFLFVDDLITDSENRSKGYGDTLFDWLVAFAKKEGCQEFHLDSGVQRFHAHRFYLRKRMSITSHHFGLSLKDEK